MFIVFRVRIGYESQGLASNGSNSLKTLERPRKACLVYTLITADGLYSVLSGKEDNLDLCWDLMSAEA